MSSDDDLTYRRNVRNMSIVLAAIVITIFAAIFIPPYVNPIHNVYEPSVSSSSAFGFTLHLTINSTSIPPTEGILLTGWVNSTGLSVENVTAADSWAFPQTNLAERACTQGWPIGVGVMQGHYTQDNYTLGTLLPIPPPLLPCPAPAPSPTYFLFEAQSSKALVTINGTPTIWTIQTTMLFKQYQSGSQLQPGVYTAVLADEWGDVLTTNFLVT